jgi:cytidylate kinase
MIIAIDGPAGAGKSTTAKEVAQQLLFGYLDTGAMYRAITYKALRSGSNLEDDEALGALAAESRLELSDSHILIDGIDVTQEIRLPEVGQAVSIVSSAPSVRRQMVEKQREVADRLKDVVVEGRDIGTVVFPNADVKIFLTAGEAERARRRLIELKDKGLDIEAAAVENELRERDRLDSGREISPLQRAADARLVDTTDKSIEQVVDTIVAMATEKMKAVGG